MIHIGLSGYSYKPWVGRFYPEKTKPDAYLAYYGTRYDTVEMDGTWYRMPSEKAVETWIANTPEHFLFVPKAHRDITHKVRLKPDSYGSMEFMLKRLKPMADARRLGPMLVQLPPNLKRDDERLVAFLEGIPQGQRYAFEFRNDTWNCPEVLAMLSAKNAAWVGSETDEKDLVHHDTADFLYVRLRKLAYDDAALQAWAAKFRAAHEAGKECFVFCKHEDEGSPWEWADRLRELVAG